MVKTKARRITIFGDVQGVGFRYYIRNEAVELGIRGVVRNKDDGSVEAITIGEDDSISKFIKQCYLGPDDAKVDFVNVEEISINDSFKDFRILF